MNKQEIFDKVLTGLRAQAIASISETSNGCRYRGKNGTMCAAGMLVTDEEFDPKWEGRSVDDLSMRCWWPARLIDDVPLARALQTAHDSAMPRFPRKENPDLHDLRINRWEELMAGVAKEFNLNYTGV